MQVTEHIDQLSVKNSEIEKAGLEWNSSNSENEESKESQSVSQQVLESTSAVCNGKKK